MKSIEALQSELVGRQLPGAELTVEPLESTIADYAWLSPEVGDAHEAHPAWLVVFSLRGMGISVDELCRLADKGEADTLMLGQIDIAQAAPLAVGQTYRTEARIETVERRLTRDGRTLDSVLVSVGFGSEGDLPGNVVRSTYVFLREAA